MNKAYLVVTMVLIMLCTCKRDPLARIPAFNLLLEDSITVFNTGDIPEGKPIVLIHFSADCTDCQHETEEILKKMDSLKQVQFYFFTIEPMERLHVFIQHYKLKNYPNILAGLDTAHFFRKHFDNYTIPLIAVYDGRKDLRAVIKGATPVNQLIKIVNEIQ